MTATAVPRPTPNGRSVTLVTGASLPILKAWPDGSYLCPWCGHPVASEEGWNAAPERGEYPRDMREAYDAGRCPDPACPAYPGATPERVTALLAERERLAEEHRQHEERRARWQHEARERKERQERRWAEVSTEAKGRGACLICLLRSSWEWGEPKYIRHRAANYHEGRR